MHSGITTFLCILAWLDQKEKMWICNNVINKKICTLRKTECFFLKEKLCGSYSNCYVIVITSHKPSSDIHFARRFIFMWFFFTRGKKRTTPNFVIVHVLKVVIMMTLFVISSLRKSFMVTSCDLSSSLSSLLVTCLNYGNKMERDDETTKKHIKLSTYTYVHVRIGQMMQYKDNNVEDDEWIAWHGFLIKSHFYVPMI